MFSGERAGGKLVHRRPSGSARQSDPGGQADPRVTGQPRRGVLHGLAEPQPIESDEQSEGGQNSHDQTDGVTAAARQLFGHGQGHDADIGIPALRLNRWRTPHDGVLARR